MEHIETWKIIVGLVATLCAGTRAAGWVRAVLTVLKVLSDGVERSANLVPSTSPLSTAKALVKEDMAGRNGGAAALAATLAAKAETRVGVVDGSATQERKTTKAKRIIQSVARWAPVLGAFL